MKLKKSNKAVNRIALGCCVLLLSGCATYQPAQTDNICKIFKESPKWYWAAQRTEKKWDVPIAVQMAVIKQESHFQAKVKPPRKKLFGFIPWFRPSSAYGYAQALDQTWDEYKTDTGSAFSKRNDFKASTDFIGWYAANARKRAGIPAEDAGALYLAYHEGVGGYQRKTYLGKPWLLAVSEKVDRCANQYATQLERCESNLPKKHWWNIG